jgi:hypothetical protein
MGIARVEWEARQTESLAFFYILSTDIIEQNLPVSAKIITSFRVVDEPVVFVWGVKGRA